MPLPDNTSLQGGKYMISRFLSSGGFGCTYEGYHNDLKIRIAIKEFFVKDYCDRGPDGTVTLSSETRRPLINRLREKFLDEARALARMYHEGIVHVYDVFEENGTAYYVMDYIDGNTLRDIVKRDGAMDEARAVGIVRRAAAALKYVHERNRLHLDIKPANIMVDAGGRVFIIDFGVSKQYDEVDGSNTSTLMGMTPGYAAVEQMSNNVSLFTPATDVYSLAGTLYYLLSATDPIPATDRSSGEDLAPLPAGVSEATRRAVDRAMVMNRNRRTPSVDAFIADLDTPVAKPELPKKKNTVDEVVTKPLADISSVKPNPVSKPTPAPSAPSAPSAPGGRRALYALIAVAALAVISFGAYLVVRSLNSTTGAEKDVLSDSLAYVLSLPDTINVTGYRYVDSNGNEFIYSGRAEVTVLRGVDDDYVDTIPEGMGVGKYKEVVYEGEYVMGLPNGNGKMKVGVDGSPDVYEGTFKYFDIVSGTLSYGDGSGDVYEGTFSPDFKIKDGILKRGKDGMNVKVVNGQLQRPPRE